VYEKERETGRQRDRKREEIGYEQKMLTKAIVRRYKICSTFYILDIEVCP
jgi:hypothetical protein